MEEPEDGDKELKLSFWSVSTKITNRGQQRVLLRQKQKFIVSQNNYYCI